MLYNCACEREWNASTCRASTAAACSSFGVPSDAIAAPTAASVTALKRARHTLCPRTPRCSTGSTTCITSKQMFSPSRSQSSHSTSSEQPRAARCRCAMTPAELGTFTVSAPKSDAGFTSHKWYASAKSRLNTCPRTDVTRWMAAAPRHGRWSSCTSMPPAPPLVVTCALRGESAEAMQHASEGFSATCSTRAPPARSVIWPSLTYVQHARAACAVGWPSSLESDLNSRGTFLLQQPPYSSNGLAGACNFLYLENGRGRKRKRKEEASALLARMDGRRCATEPSRAPRAPRAAARVHPR